MIHGAAPHRPAPPALPEEPAEAPPPVRFCRDCKHCQPVYKFAAYSFGLGRKGWRHSLEYATCGHPSATLEHTEQRVKDWIITGMPSARPATSQSYCSSERSHSGAQHCGPEGRFWDRRDVPLGWRNPATRHALLRAILSAWGWVMASVALGLGGGALLNWAMAP